jgi:CPA1 family monovalent cation:H+ antiporter
MARRVASARAVFALSVTWDFLGFVANSLIFLFIGIELDPPTLARNWLLITVAFAAALVGRLVAVDGPLPWLRGRRRIPWKYHPALFWGGLRGAVSLALSLPLTIANGEPFPQRNILQTVAFGLLGASLLLQGLTMRWAVRALKLADSAASEASLDLARSRLYAVEGALLVLARERDQGETGGLEYERLSTAYERECAELRRQIAGAQDDETTEIAQD